MPCMHMCCALFTAPGNNVQPDLSAPGIDILAAWTPLSPVSGNLKDSRFAAYVKSFHPDWSPAMIMSALITTGNSHRSSTPRSAHTPHT
jgi:hypothetical protein